MDASVKIDLSTEKGTVRVGFDLPLLATDDTDNEANLKRRIDNAISDAFALYRKGRPDDSSSSRPSDVGGSD